MKFRSVHGAAFGTTSLLLAGALLFGEGASSRAPSTATAAVRNAQKTSSSGATYTSAGLFGLGVEREFELSETSSIETTKGQPITKLVLQGPLKLTALREVPTVLVHAEYGGTVAITAGATPAADAALTDSAHRAFVLEFAGDGKFLGVLGAAELVPAVGRTWTSLGESLQLTRPSGDDHWQAVETDAMGTYTAEYEQRGRHAVYKHKVRYDSLSSRGISEYEVLASRVTFDLDADAHLASFHLAEQTRASLDRMPGFAGTTSLSLSFVSGRAASAHLQQWLADANSATPVAASTLRQQEAALDRARIGGLSDGEVFERLQGFTTEGAGSDERDRAGRAFVALAAKLRQDPTMIDKVKARLRAHGDDTTVMLAALRDSSTPAAQRVLADMSAPGSPLPASDRMEAARSLSRVATPTADTVESLKRLRSDPEVGTQATYGLGSALHRLKDSNPELAGDVRQTLTGQLDSAATSFARVVALNALGNAGDPSTLDQIRAYASSEAPDVRAAAAQALRRIAGADADGLLAGLAADRVVSVRYSAVDAISERLPSAVLAQAVVPLALSETDFQLRARSVNLMARWLSDLPWLVPTLERIAKNDPNADLRNTATTALRFFKSPSERQPTGDPGPPSRAL